MLPTLSSNQLGLLGQLRDIQHNRRVAERHWPVPPGIHATKLHGSTGAEDAKSLPLCLLDRSSHHDLPGFHNTARSQS